MEKEFVTYDIAEKLKELGFGKVATNQSCMAVFKTETDLKFFSTVYFVNTKESTKIAAPLWQQVIDWLREEKSCYIESVTNIVNEFGMVNTEYRVLIIYTGEHPSFKGSKYSTRDFKEKTLESAILKAFELIRK